MPWQMHRGVEAFAEGTDTLTFGEDGRITSITAFVDRAPDGFDPDAYH